jgi:hypothetical protein
MATQGPLRCPCVEARYNLAPVGAVALAGAFHNCDILLIVDGWAEHAMSSEPDLEHGIYRVLHTLQIGDVHHIVESDLIFRDGSPTVVFEWGGPEDHQYPAVTLELDLELLSDSAGRPGYFDYSGQIVDPRSKQ